MVCYVVIVNKVAVCPLTLIISIGDLESIVVVSADYLVLGQLCVLTNVGVRGNRENHVLSRVQVLSKFHGN